MKTKKETERDLVNRLIKAIKINTKSPVYVFVDRDSGVQRHTKSGWDFCIVWQGKTAFVETKVKTKQSDFQKLTQKEIEAANGHYVLLHFKDGWFDTGSNAGPIHNAEAMDFFI